MKEVELLFEITQASVLQKIKMIDESYTKDMIIEGLRAGELVTSTWHNGQSGIEAGLETIHGKVIGVITSQEVDGEYEAFK